MARNKAQIRLRIEKLQRLLKRLELQGRIGTSDQRVKLAKARELIAAAETAVDDPKSLQDPEQLLRLAEPIINILEPLDEGG